MTIKIFYEQDKMFDIEFYLAYSESDDRSDKWYSEIECCECIKGVAMFLKDHINLDGFNLDEFISDTEIIEEIRGWLWEQHSNKPLKYDECSTRHYKEYLPELKDILNEYINKYDLYIVTD